MGDDWLAVDQDVLHSLRQLIGLLESCNVTDRRGIEDHDVGPHAALEHSSINQAHTLGGQSAELADRLLQTEYVLLAHVLAEDPRERAVGTRMGVLLSQQTLRRGTLRVVVD